MSGVSSSVGLISGLPIGDIVNKLLAIEARPAQQLKARVSTVQQQRAAYLALSAQILALKNAAARFDEANFFRSSSAVSSNDNVLSPKAAENTPVGTYRFQVASLVTNHQLVSNGMADKDETPVGRGTITIESARARVNPATFLDSLNEQRGVQRGSIRIRDRAGNVADVDLRTALTVTDVLAAINARVDINVRASVRGDGIVLTDVSGGTGSLVVSDIGTGRTAADLGIAGSVSGSELVGSPLLRITEGTALAGLNDETGVRRAGTARPDGDFIVHLDGRSLAVNLSGLLRRETRLEELNSGQGVRLGRVQITNRAGRTGTVDLTNRGDGQPPRNIAEILQIFQAARDDETGESLNISVSTVNSSFIISDTSVAATASARSNLIVKDLDGGFAAQDLGLVTNTAESAFRGNAVYRVRTVGDALRAIQYAAVVERDAAGVYAVAQDAEGRYQYNGGEMTAAIASDGKRITLHVDSDGSSIELRNGSKAALDLGLIAAGTFDESTGAGAIGSERVIAGLNTVLLKSLNGGKGVGRGVIRIEAGDGLPGMPGSGTTTLVDLSGAQTLQDVLDAINATSATSRVRAEISESGLGIVLRDQSGGAGLLTVADVDGTAAADLKLAGSGAGVVGNGNLQRQYINESTPLANLGGGAGVPYGRFRITNAANTMVTVELSSQGHTTVGDAIRAINAAGASAGISARINDTGDGILLEDASGGAGRLKVEEVGVTKTAAGLRLLGEAAKGATTIDGSFEIRIEAGSDDTLEKVRAKMNAADPSILATIINDGSRLDPYRLSVLSRVSGTPGELLIDGGSTKLRFGPLVEARDAVVFFGDPQSPDSIRLISPTNTVSGFIDGLTLNLTGTSSQPVEVSVARDVEKIVSDVKTFTTLFNSTVDNIKKLTAYDQETNTRGLLLGDATISTIQSRLYSMLTASVTGADPRYQRLSDVGLTIGDGARLEFNEERFRAAYAADPAAVEKLFTYETVQQVEGKPVTRKLGLGHRIDAVLEGLTAASTGLIARETQDLISREEFFNERIKEMEAMLEKKRARLEAQFQAMEKALATLQQQQSALGSLSAIVASSRNLGSLG